MDDAPNTHRGCMSPLCSGQVSAAQEPARCCCFQTKSCAYYLALQLQWGVRATTLTNISSEIYETMNVQSMHGQTQQTEASMGSHVVDKDTAEHGASLHSLHASTPVRAKKHAPQSTDLAVFPLQQPTTSWWHIKDGRKLHVILKSRAVLTAISPVYTQPCCAAELRRAEHVSATLTVLLCPCFLCAAVLKGNILPTVWMLFH